MYFCSRQCSWRRSHLRRPSSSTDCVCLSFIVICISCAFVISFISRHIPDLSPRPPPREEAEARVGAQGLPQCRRRRSERSHLARAHVPPGSSQGGCADGARAVILHLLPPSPQGLIARVYDTTTHPCATPHLHDDDVCTFRYSSTAVSARLGRRNDFSPLAPLASLRRPKRPSQGTSPSRLGWTRFTRSTLFACFGFSVQPAMTWVFISDGFKGDADAPYRNLNGFGFGLRTRGFKRNPCQIWFKPCPAKPDRFQVWFNGGLKGVPFRVWFKPPPRRNLKGFGFGLKGGLKGVPVRVWFKTPPRRNLKGFGFGLKGGLNGGPFQGLV